MAPSHMSGAEEVWGRLALLRLLQPPQERAPIASLYLTCMPPAFRLAPQGIDWSDLHHWGCNDNVHPSREGTYDSISFHPYETVRPRVALPCRLPGSRAGVCPCSVYLAGRYGRDWAGWGLSVAWN